ncbi:hypothetical protein BVZ47_01547B, partial [Haemophilus influenzae]
GLWLDRKDCLKN